MKLTKILLPLAAAVVLPLAGNAKPAYPGVLQGTNPDGSVREFRIFGDEFFSIMTDVDGVGLLEHNAKGQLVPMMREGRQLLNTDETRAMLRTEQAALIPQANPMQKAPMQKAGALEAKTGRTLFPSVGNAKTFVLLVEYKDIKFSLKDPQKEISRMLNEPGYSEYDHVGSARDFYLDSSNGLFQPEFIVSRVVTLPFSSEYYCGANGKYSNFAPGLADAVNELANEYDFTQFDMDGDGNMDLLYVVYAGYGQADSGKKGTIWPHQGTLGFSGPMVDGIRVTSYACSSELRGGRHVALNDNCLDGIGTVVHEYGHALGLPDLYDPNYNSACTTPGLWSTMDSGTYNGDGAVPPQYSSYEKWMLRWIEYTEITPDKDYTVRPLSANNDVAYRLTGLGSLSNEEYPNEYFVFESRSKNNKWDSALPYEGMLIWHIDFSATAWIQNRVNSTVGHPRCVPVQAHDGSKPHFPGVRNHFYVLPEQNYLTLFSDQEQPMDACLTKIKFDSKTGTSSFHYSKEAEKHDAATMVNVKKKIISPRGFYISWPSCGDEYRYLVTVRYDRQVGAENPSVLISNGVEYENYYTGTCTDMEFLNLSNSTQRSEMTVTVMPYNGMPSSVEPEEVRFVPYNLEETIEPGQTGVEITGADVDDAPIYAAGRDIVAPAGARVFTLSGIETGHTDLMPGVYVVRTATRTVKVNVR